MLGSKGAGFFTIILLLRAQLPQPHLLPLRDRSLRSQATKDKLTGLIQPMPGERVDHLTPNALFEDI
jgi:hypothetical protein